MSDTQRAPLAPDIETRLHMLAASDDADVSRRARLILRIFEGVSVAEVAVEMGMSTSGVRHWMKQFREKGLIALGGGVPDLPPEPVPQAVAEKPKRPGRPKKAAAPDPIPEPEPEPEIIAQAEPEPPPKRLGRPKKATAAPIPLEVIAPEREEITTQVWLIEPEAEPPALKPGRGRRKKTEPDNTITAETVAMPEAEPEVSPEFPPEPAPTVKPGRGRRKKADLIDLEAIPEIVVIVEPPAPVLPPITTVRGLVDRYGVNLVHAQHVTELAYQLFDATAEVHRLPDHERRLLEAGALLHGIADDLDPDRHHEIARDIILETPLEKYTLNERAMIALLAAFHRKKVHAGQELAYQQLPEALQRDTLALAAILRIADGLDASLTQTTRIDEVTLSGHELTIRITGENADQDALRAKAKADLWQAHLHQYVMIERVTDAQSDPLNEPPTVPILSAPPMMRDQMPDLVLTLDPGMSAARAVRKLAFHYCDRLDRFAVAVRNHEMYRLAPFSRELDRVIGLLALSSTERFRDSLDAISTATNDAVTAYAIYDRAMTIADDPDDPNAATVAGQMDAWQNDARAKLDSLDFERFAHTLSELRKELVSEPPNDSGALIATLVAPVVWTQLADLRDVVERGESVSEALTAARNLQDYLLYFRSLLGSETVQALDTLAPFENYLTTIHTVQAILGALGGNDAASTVVRNAQEAVLNELAEGLPSIWASVNSVSFRRAVALALAAP